MTTGARGWLLNPGLLRIWAFINTEESASEIDFLPSLGSMLCHVVLGSTYYMVAVDNAVVFRVWKIKYGKSGCEN